MKSSIYENEMIAMKNIWKYKCTESVDKTNNFTIITNDLSVYGYKL